MLRMVTAVASTVAGSPGSRTRSSALPSTVVRALLTFVRISTMKRPRVASAWAAAHIFSASRAWDSAWQRRRISRPARPAIAAQTPGSRRHSRIERGVGMNQDGRLAGGGERLLQVFVQALVQVFALDIVPAFVLFIFIFIV